MAGRTATCSASLTRRLLRLSTRRCSAGCSTGADSLGEREVKRKVRGEDRVAKYAAVGELPKFIEAFEQAKKAASKDEIVKLDHELRPAA